MDFIYQQSGTEKTGKLALSGFSGSDYTAINPQECSELCNSVKSIASECITQLISGCISTCYSCQHSHGTQLLTLNTGQSKMPAYSDDAVCHTAGLLMYHVGSSAQVKSTCYDRRYSSSQNWSLRELKTALGHSSAFLMELDKPTTLQPSTVKTVWTQLESKKNSTEK